MAAPREIPVPAPTPVRREDVLDYTPHPKSVALARHRASRLVAEWGYPHLAGDAAVLLSELATNAVVHGRVPGRMFRVRLTLTDTVLRIAVSDAQGERLPRPRVPRPDAAFGRGMVIVEALGARWGVEEREVGKTVWCEVAL